MTVRTALVQGSDEPTTAAVARRLTADGFQVTVAGDGDPQADVDRAAGSAGSLDALVCAVGRPPAGPLSEADPAEWYSGVMACLTPAFRLVRAGVPALRRSGSGRIVLLGSGWTTADRPEQTAASAVHGAIVALTKTLARDLGPDGITVNEVVADPAAPAPPEVVAEAVAYLCGPAAASVVGQLVTLGTGGGLRP